MTKYMKKLEMLFMPLNVFSCTGRLHPRPNLRDFPCSESIMNVPHQHKGKQVTAGG